MLKMEAWLYYMSDLPLRRIRNLECEKNEAMFLGMKLKYRTWGISGNYRPPATNDNSFELDFSSKLDQMFIRYDHVCVIGDLNYKYLYLRKVWPCKIFVSLLISQILLKKKHVLIDVILTNSPNYPFDTINFDCGLSDCHIMLATVFKESSTSSERRTSKFQKL